MIKGPGARRACCSTQISPTEPNHRPELDLEHNSPSTPSRLLIMSTSAQIANWKLGATYHLFGRHAT